MSIENYQLTIISKVATLQDIALLQQIDSLLLAKKNQQILKREPGFAKGFFTYVAPDFDDFIPSGFEEYLATDSQLVKPTAK
ncbi:MAG: hypothetical protein U5N85_05370 [Arcicella sp.]|nr:hypothetical protein [Arcicella sp.]